MCLKGQELYFKLINNFIFSRFTFNVASAYKASVPISENSAQYMMVERRYTHYQKKDRKVHVHFVQESLVQAGFVISHPSGDVLTISIISAYIYVISFSYSLKIKDGKQGL